jgi:hypothetical protein
MPGKGIKRKQGLGHDAVDQFAKATVHCTPKELYEVRRQHLVAQSPVGTTSDQRRRMADLEQARKVLKEAPDTTSVAAMEAARADSDAESGSSPTGSSRDCGSASSDDTDERKARPTPSSDNEVDDSDAESGSSPVRPFFDPRRATDVESSDSEACDCEEATECGGCGESYPDSEWVTMQAAPGICNRHPAWCGHCVDQACSLDEECSPLGGGGPTTCSCGFDAQNWDEQLAPCFGCDAICHSHCQGTSRAWVRVGGRGGGEGCVCAPTEAGRIDRGYVGGVE